MNLQTLQREVAEWHSQEYPDATMSALGCKLGEELGEVCREVDRWVYGRGDRQRMADEIGDAVIVLAAICQRAGIDLHNAVIMHWLDDVSLRTGHRMGDAS